MTNKLTCYFCNEKRHGQQDCHHIADLIEKGILVKGETGTTLKDGSYVPRSSDGLLKKDKVMKLAIEKGWTKHKGKEQFFFYKEQDDDPNYFAFAIKESPIRQPSMKDPIRQLGVMMFNMMKDSLQEGENEAALLQDLHLKN